MLAAAAVAALIVAGFLVIAIRARAPYHVDEKFLSGWKVAAAPPGDPAVVEARPPAELLEELFSQVSRRIDHGLVAPERAAVPLVLSGEYSDSLQGAVSIDDIVNTGLDVGLDSVRFEPVCIGQRWKNDEELVFAVFDAPEFDRFRLELTPLFPEHAGSGVYDPPGLRLILAVAASSRNIDAWWPLGLNPLEDCSVSLRAD
jgi:hypothetical protein